MSDERLTAEINETRRRVIEGRASTEEASLFIELRLCATAVPEGRQRAMSERGITVEREVASSDGRSWVGSPVPRGSQQVRLRLATRWFTLWTPWFITRFGEASDGR